ncbi:hypothetical protein PIB30_003558 [Stylosanthes scabra]|uniref:F-box associated beta-propeller type 1 domain-containing protein n=1 Tax=Stylosanthes scabra TaxID=79078 RepID=A0ABU6X3H5_9FABA|nr:hypothetical protein [Stylosanthes scabra]
MATPAKGSLDSIVVNSSLKILTSPEEKGSNNKTFRRVNETFPMKLETKTGESSDFYLPFLLSHEGWVQIIGVENGVFCLRYCPIGRKVFLRVWNPATREIRKLSSPAMHAPGFCSCVYAFCYYAKSIHYGVAHFFKEHETSLAYKLVLYTSLTGGWETSILCPTFVRNLDPTYVSLNGTIYMLTIPTEEEELPTVVSFSLETRSFQQFQVPAEVAGHCHGLYLLDGRLCLAGNEHFEDAYTTTMWEINNIHEQPTWTQLFYYHGDGNAYIPAAFDNGDLIQVMESHDPIGDEQNNRYSLFHVTRYLPQDETTSTLQYIEHDNIVALKSVNVYHETIFPV